MGFGLLPNGMLGTEFFLLVFNQGGNFLLAFLREEFKFLLRFLQVGLTDFDQRFQLPAVCDFLFKLLFPDIGSFLDPAEFIFLDGDEFFPFLALVGFGLKCGHPHGKLFFELLFMGKQGVFIASQRFCRLLVLDQLLLESVLLVFQLNLEDFKFLVGFAQGGRGSAMLVLRLMKFVRPLLELPFELLAEKMLFLFSLPVCAGLKGKPNHAFNEAVVGNERNLDGFHPSRFPASLVRAFRAGELAGFHDADGSFVVVARGGGHDFEDGLSDPILLGDAGPVGELPAGIEVAATGILHMDIGGQGIEDAVHEPGLACELFLFALLLGDILLGTPYADELVVFDQPNHIVEQVKPVAARVLPDGFEIDLLVVGGD